MKQDTPTEDPPRRCLVLHVRYVSTPSRPPTGRKKKKKKKKVRAGDSAVWCRL